MLSRLTALTLILTLFWPGAPARAQDQSFAAFTAELWPDAQAKGITRASFDIAMRGVTPDPRVIAATKRQPEYGKPVGAYINDIVSIGRIKRGGVKAQEWARVFDAVEKKFQVERSVLVALWGMESDYGAAKDKWDVFRSLSTLAYVKYRHPYFRNELIVAMGIMQRAGFKRAQMVSSWAGAMGQTQFMPTNVVDFAIDFSGDGKSDIWNNVPDVLASTGNYLQKGKWRYGLPWGFEVVIPKGFDMMHSRGSFADWRGLGLRRADGKAFPAAGSAILFFPAGASGACVSGDGKFRRAEGVQ
jgi:membrane-bound lytic murein transglycosylase B